MTKDEIYEANGGAIWGISEEGYLCMARAILSTETIQPIGYMIIVCSSYYFGNAMTTKSGTFSVRTYLADTNGQILASTEGGMLGEWIDASAYTSTSGTVRDPGTGEVSYCRMRSDGSWILITTETTKQFRRSLAAILTGMLIVMCGIWLVSNTVAGAAAKRLTEPTERLVEGMAAFGRGNMDTRVQVTGQDEISVLTADFNKMADRVENLILQVYELELANKEAEIEFLKMQINPHFLYNSLDIISWMGFSCGSSEITDMAVSLAEILRAGVKQSPVIQLKEEIKIIEDYLRVQYYRFGDRISATIDVPEEVQEYYLPGFLLQPLIENSFVHGLEDVYDRKGEILVRIRRKENWLNCEVKDNGFGMSEEALTELMNRCRDKHQRKSIGISNVYRRLHILYGDDCLFRIISREGEGTSVSFRIRVVTEQPELMMPVEDNKEQTDEAKTDI